MKDWFKGGIISSIIYTGLTIATFPLGDNIIATFLAYSLLLPVFATNVLLCKSSTCAIVMSLFSSLLTGFLIGAIIGFIIGKFRKKGLV